MTDPDLPGGFRGCDPGSSDFRVERYPFFLLNRLVSRYNGIIERRLRPIGLDIPAWRVLMILGERDPQGTREIANAAVINLSTTTRIVQRMRTEGLVSLSNNEADARVTLVSLTAAGRARLPAAREASAPIFQHLVDGVSPDAFETLVELLNQFHSNLEPLSASRAPDSRDRPATSIP
jgi:MarR family transcriptional regulator, organic hydroperoxide resistance regulator